MSSKLTSKDIMNMPQLNGQTLIYNSNELENKDVVCDVCSNSVKRSNTSDVEYNLDGELKKHLYCTNCLSCLYKIGEDYVEFKFLDLQFKLQKKEFLNISHNRDYYGGWTVGQINSNSSIFDPCNNILSQLQSQIHEKAKMQFPFSFEQIRWLCIK